MESRRKFKLKFSSSEIRREKETETGLFWNGLKGSSHMVFSSFYQESRSKSPFQRRRRYRSKGHPEGTEERKVLEQLWTLNTEQTPDTK